MDVNSYELKDPAKIKKHKRAHTKRNMYHDLAWKLIRLQRAYFMILDHPRIHFSTMHRKDLRNML
jgi:hypothetical protein